MLKLPKGLIGFFIGAGLVGYFAIGVATAVVMGFIGATSNEPDAWWANIEICIFAWPLVWIAAFLFARSHQ